jgi:hypothetical protein
MRLPIKGIGREYRAPKKPESDERQAATAYSQARYSTPLKEVPQTTWVS